MEKEIIHIESYLDKFNFERYEKKKILREVVEEYTRKKVQEEIPKNYSFDLYIDVLGYLK